MTSAKREALAKKLDAFEAELEKRRLSILAVTRVAMEILALPGGVWASAELAPKLITNIMQTVAEAKAAETETRQLPPAAPPKALSAPRAPEPEPQRRGGFADDLDDEVPFLAEGLMCWFRRSGRVTADTARRITGISVPFGGIQWADPGPSDREVVRQFIVFMEDRRVLYNAMDLEVLDQVQRSIHEIREQCTRTLQALPPGAFAANPIRNIREAGRRFHDDRNEDFASLMEDGPIGAALPAFSLRWGPTGPSPPTRSHC